MAADAPVGRVVVKSTAAGQSARRSPQRQRKAAAHRVPLRPPSRLHVEHSVDSAISLAKRSDSLSRATIFFFTTTPCGYSRKFCKITRRKRMIHSGRTRLEVSQRRSTSPRGRNAAAETRVEVLPHSPGGSCVFNVVIAEANSWFAPLASAKRGGHHGHPCRRRFAFLFWPR